MVDLSKLNICFLAGTLGQGGAERQLYYILKTLRKQGAAVRLLSLSQGEFWEAKIRALGIPVTWVGQSDPRLIRLFKILAVLSNDPPDVFQSQHFYTNPYVGVAARLLRIPSVGAIRSHLTQEIRKVGHLSSLALRLPRMVAANSLAAINGAQARGITRERLYYLPNAVNTERFSPLTNTKEMNRYIQIIAVGRLINEKRIDRFLEVIAELHKQLTIPLRARIVGDGPQRGFLEQYARQLNLLPESVEFSGKVSDTERIYKASDILLLTSDWEGTPNVVLEAMASGVPVVATKVGDVPEIVEDGRTGFLVEPDDTAAMIETTARLVRDSSLRQQVGTQARNYVTQHYSLSRLPGYLCDLYERALLHPNSVHS
jgi:glycosyltransferase involved in cell wall biosynthesis